MRKVLEVMVIAKKKVAVVDLFGGNIQSVMSCLSGLDIDKRVSRLDEVSDLDVIILPGVTNSSGALGTLQKATSNYRTLVDWIRAGQPVIGICAGLQVLAKSTAEIGTSSDKGLNMLDGHVVHLDNISRDIISPVIGWYPVDGFGLDKKYYFCHSYFVSTSQVECVAGYQSIGRHKVPAIFRHENIWGFQFHPERSGEAGRKLMEATLKSFR